ncbi:MAG: alpha-2-macroglobulin, partial [Planctomycetes bacterium]|nr:alpha-2-macroglobulin [Planctomycetota bacterium]
AGEKTRRVYRFQPSIVEGEAGLKASGGQTGLFEDTIQGSFKVVPEGFPVVGAKSDLLEQVASLKSDLVLPPTWVKGTLKFQVAVYPSTLADLQKGLEGLLREPNGCFEQTSTSNYPNLLILDYLRETDQAQPQVAQQAQEMLGRGYEKLLSFECLDQAHNQRQGYEWFGGTAPPHEALTAYGLMQFRDMARVRPVDAAMLERTRQYLMSRRDGKGGFLRNPSAVDTFGRAPELITNAYIVWALTESGKQDDITRELDTLNQQAQTSSDPYFLALVGLSLLNRDRPGEALVLLQKIAQAQKPEGYLDAAQTSITSSGGRDLQIETTALALYGWLKARRSDLFEKNVQAAVKWIGQQRGGYGGFGSTQSTILALKALIAYARDHKQAAQAGRLSLFVDNREVVARDFPAGAQEALVLELPDAEKYLKPGPNNVRVEITGDKNRFPFTATWSYQTLKPISDSQCAVSLTTRLDRTDFQEGDTAHLIVDLENKSGQGQGMTVAIVGLPAGLTLPEDMKKLKDLARLPNDGSRPVISAFEIRGRELVLYWRDLPPDARGDKKIHFDLPLICRVPGEYRGPASRAYLYYNADHKDWVEPLKVTIHPEKEEVK